MMANSNDVAEALQRLLIELQQIDDTFYKKLNDLKAERQADLKRVYHEFTKKLRALKSDQHKLTNIPNFPINLT